MGKSRRYPANQSLTWERLQRGWSHDELAEQVKRCMREAGEADTGLTGNTVRRWEIGERWPEPRYRKHLVLVFGRPASQLGLLTPEERAQCPADALILELVERLGSVLYPGSARVGRQTLLRGVLGVGLAPALGAEFSVDGLAALTRALDDTAGADPEAVAAYADITMRQRALYWSTPARTLFEAALAHTQLGVQLLHGASSGPIEVLASSLAESALLSSRLAFFDLRQPAIAQRTLDVALVASRRADDHALAVAVLAHMSFIPGFAGDGPLAADLLAAAQKHVRYDSGPMLRSWLHCVAAEVSARTGDPIGSLRHVRQAGDSLGTSGDDPAWLDFYDASRLAGFTGQAMLIADRRADAVAALETALAGLAGNAVKQRAVLLADLAAAHAPDDAERAAGLASEAVDVLERDWYGTAYDRLVRLQHALAGTPRSAELAERMRELPAANY